MRDEAFVLMYWELTEKWMYKWMCFGCGAVFNDEVYDELGRLRCPVCHSGAVVENTVDELLGRERNGQAICEGDE